MEAYLTILLAPHEAHGKSAAQLATRRLVTDPAEQAGTQHMQLGFGNRLRDDAGENPDRLDACFGIELIA
jgi:hypothetical protein